MTPDDAKQAWSAYASQTRMNIDAERLLAEVQRNQRSFEATIFWRDVREIGVSLVMAIAWVYLGLTLSLPWTWYLMVLALLWVASYMLLNRVRYRWQPNEPGEPLRDCVKGSLGHLEHQIWLLRTIHWWYLLPVGVSCLAFVGEVKWRERPGGWLTVFVVSVAVGIVAAIFFWVYRLNQFAIRSELEPRRRELETLMMSLDNEMPETATS
jgi:hypothetical protein